jgi:hypothetical protein
MTTQELIARLIKRVKEQGSERWQINQYLDGELMIIGQLYTEVPADSNAAANLDILVQLISEIRLLVNAPTANSVH